MSIPFTQYLRPNGRKKPVTIDRPEAVEALAATVIEAGGAFEIEELRTGEASVTCAFNEMDIAIKVVPNGPAVPAAVDKVVADAYRHITGLEA